MFLITHKFNTMKKYTILFIAIFSNYVVILSCNIQTTDSLFYMNIESLYSLEKTYKPFKNTLIFLETLKTCDIYSADIQYDYAIKINITKKDIKKIKNWYRKNRKRLNYNKFCRIYRIWDNLDNHEYIDKTKSYSNEQVEQAETKLINELKEIAKEPTIFNQ
mgnify:CR=1 FL=1